jgi:hypothetical protein
MSKTEKEVRARLRATEEMKDDPVVSRDKSMSISDLMNLETN